MWARSGLALVVVGLGGCGARAPGAAPAVHAEVETCQRERRALEQRLAAAKQRVEELESGSAVAPVAAASESGDAEELRIQFPRDELDALLSDSATLMKSARVVPVSRDGRVTGIRLFGMRAGTTLSRLGFQNGDEVRSVNGYELTSPEKTLEAYAAVRKASELRIEIIRKGRPLGLVLEVVDPPTR